jgi:hypothetical protein
MEASMSVFRRIGDLFRMFLDLFVDRAESGVPLERRLAYDRAKRATNLKNQMDRAEDVGSAAEMMVQQLAEARIIAANLRSEARAHLEAAMAAGARGDDVTRAQEEARATTLAEELAEAEADVGELEALVSEALSDKKESIAMVLDQSRELERLARGDSRLVAKIRMTEMRRQQLELREEMMQLVPGDQDNLRARIEDKAKTDEARFKARRDVVDALWAQKRRQTMDQTLSTSAAGRAKLAELKGEVGYVEAAPAAPPPAETATQENAAEAGGGTTGP